ncbi:Saccharolysin [Colletotrichum gloeosporioides]|uniref:Saccharolysin n=1 Tax=Colletotrichum gloeosporioides TaxID=474922 RepID=A0A8H4CEV7_COLGL|nr:Saccharolysin [Colletotrichum gloeosporioides]KAF3802553.1 Saccharolysin [Colletotrichum gloeosporioides]
MTTTNMIPSQEPPRLIAAKDVVPIIKQVIKEQTDTWNHVAATINPASATFDTAIRPLINVDNETQGRIAVIAMLRYASPDQLAREASDAAIRLLRQWDAERIARKDFYHLLKAVEDKSEDVHFEDAKFLRSNIQQFTRGGHGRLDQDQVAVYLNRRNQIDELRQQCNRNYRNDDGGLWLSLDELEGVPAEDLARFSGSQDSTDVSTKDKAFVRFTRADVNAVLQYATAPSTRKEVYVSNESKVPENVDLFKQVIDLRDENARLLGYENHAAFRLEARVAKATTWVNGFLDELEDVLLRKGREEMASLLEIRKKDVPQDNDSMPPWDYDYYNRLMQERIDVKHGRISEYFPLDYSVSAMLDLFASCLQLRFVPLTADQKKDVVWHDDVQVWAVWDERDASKGVFVGYLYTDLLIRPKKHQGSQNVNLQCGYLRPDDTRVYPATILMCAFPRPTTTGCALLKHSEIVSLFHELGHGMHDLVSRTRTVMVHGHRMPPDFFEVPSVMLENWCWMADELRHMSCHYTRLNPELLDDWRRKNPGQPDPPEKIPDELLGPLVRSRNVNRALWLLRQLAFARFDMAVHSPATHEECLHLDVAEIFNDTMERLRLLPNPDAKDRGHPQSNFHHMVSGMDAGYYSYLCAAVFAADIFHHNFVENPRSQERWERYRQGILGFGGSRDEMEMLEEFLGHKPSSEYLFDSLLGLD